MEIKFKKYESRRGVNESNPKEISMYKREKKGKKGSSSFRIGIPKSYIKDGDKFIRFGNLDNGRFFFATNNNPDLEGNLRLTNFRQKLKKYADVNCKELMLDFVDFYNLTNSVDVSFKCYVNFDVNLGVYVIGDVRTKKYFN